MLSLFLLWPTGSSLGLVLAVLGVGIWVGVQHLGYLEFGELARVAQRTLDQRQIFINNMSIRRATEELKVARDYDQVRKILLAAFGTNDFDGFDLQIAPLAGQHVPFGSSDPQPRRSELSFHWSKPGGPKSFAGLGVWTLALDLMSASHRSWGLLLMRRLYSQRDIQLDINLLTTAFTAALANALERTLAPAPHVIAMPADSSLIAAQAG
jgi:UDP-GlcNAc:undecaprenyl-phosphate GlcNAc-1-phosphate transferase